MPRVAPGQRKRAFQPKTKTGCGTCRVKCDEYKPSCLKCSSTRRRCEGIGYGNDYAESTFSSETSSRSSSPSSTSSSSTNWSPVLMSSLSLAPSTNQKECHAFHFFLQTTAPQLSGFYGENFWDSIIVQATHYEPVLHHAIVALGSLHERFMQTDGIISTAEDMKCKDNFALLHYNFAIRSLVVPLAKKERPAMDVCLTACILFACFETMQGNYGPAIAHVQSGIKILEEIDYDEATDSHQHPILRNAREPHVPMSVLLEFFMRLDLQITDMIGGRSWTLFKCFAAIRAERQSEPSEIPQAFATLSEARDSLYYHQFRASHSLRQLHAQPDNELVLAAWTIDNSRILAQWTSALTNWELSLGSPLTSTQRHGLHVLSILQILCYISLKVDRGEETNQCIWDVFIPQFDQTVSLAEAILLPSAHELDAPRSANATRKIMPTFSLDMEIVGALYAVASRCRDPLIRRRAINVMKRCARQEGMWNAALTARIAERVMQIEEEGLGEVMSCEDVPDWARISNVMPTFDQEDRRALLRYSRFEDGERGDEAAARKPVEEIVEW